MSHDNRAKLKFNLRTTSFVPLLVLLLTTGTFVSAYTVLQGSQINARSHQSNNVNYIRSPVPSVEKQQTSLTSTANNSNSSVESDSHVDIGNNENRDSSIAGDENAKASNLPAGSTENVAECSNDSVRKDFGTACLKKAISDGMPASSSAEETGLLPATNPVTLLNYNSRNGAKLSPPRRTRPASSQQPARPANTKSRHFSVRPMMIGSSKKRMTHQQLYPNQPHHNSGPFKSPVSTARQLYANKGYNQFSSSKPSNMPPAPGKFYQPQPTQNNRKGLKSNSNSVDRIEQKQQHQTEEDEWNQVNEPSYEPEQIPVVPEPEVPPPQTPETGYPGEYGGELELLVSLKKSLGILSAQTANLRQRTMMMYREAKRRKLHFFDALLARTYNFVNEKQEETREAMTDIDTMMVQIRQHHQIASLPTNLRRMRYRRQLPGFSIGKRQQRYGTRSVRTKKNVSHFNGNHSNSASNKPDRKEIDRLIEDALNHAKRMMEIIKELNEALDEFEEQFNLPRFEPNDIEVSNNSIDSKEDF